jgi:hypothetical protein
LRAPDLRIEKPGRPIYCYGRGQVTSGLAPVHGGIADCSLLIPPHSREAEFQCLGLQSYSRPLCMSRGKHHRLYP